MSRWLQFIDGPAAGRFVRLDRPRRVCTPLPRRLPLLGGPDAGDVPDIVTYRPALVRLRGWSVTFPALISDSATGTTVAPMLVSWDTWSREAVVEMRPAVQVLRWFA